MHLLWLKTELLHPLDKGGRIRSYQMLRELRRELRITYLTLDDGTAGADAAERAQEYCTTLIRVPLRTARRGSLGFAGELARNVASPLPYAIWKYRSPAMRREIASVVSQSAVDLLVCDFLAPAVNVPAGLPVPAVLFQHNVEASLWERHAAVARDPVRRTYLRSQWRRMHAFERAQCRRFDHVIAVSPDDATWFRARYGVRGASDVPTGVDTDYFRPAATASPVPTQLAFTGSMDWMPNVDAMTYFVGEILPRVRAGVPDASLSIIGRNPAPAVYALARRYPGITVTGTVPDVRPHLARAGVVIVPLRVGGGTRLKIFEAMAMQKAVVSTTIGAEGLPVRDGEHLLIADTPAEFAAAVCRLIRQPELAAALGQRAAALVRARFGWSAIAAQFADACRQVAGSASLSRSPVAIDS